MLDVPILRDGVTWYRERVALLMVIGLDTASLQSALAEEGLWKAGHRDRSGERGHGETMSSPHPLNQAVIAQALQYFREGELDLCLEMGFSVNALKALMQPALASVLANAKVSWCTVTVDSARLERYLEQVLAEQKANETVTRMLLLGASNQMLKEFFALDRREVAVRRRVLKLKNRKGRWPALNEEQDATLWRAWRDGLAARGIPARNEAAMLDLAMALAETHSVLLAVLWDAIREWSRAAQSP
jgi:hypothetical protein